MLRRPKMHQQSHLLFNPQTTAHDFSRYMTMCYILQHHVASNYWSDLSSRNISHDNAIMIYSFLYILAIFYIKSTEPDSFVNLPGVHFFGFWTSKFSPILIWYLGKCGLIEIYVTLIYCRWLNMQYVSHCRLRVYIAQWLSFIHDVFILILFVTSKRHNSFVRHILAFLPTFHQIYHKYSISFHTTILNLYCTYH